MRGTIGVLSVCLFACTKAVGGGHHVKRGDEAVARGDIYAADEAYTKAEQERGDDAWTSAAIKRGRARMVIEEMRGAAWLAVGTPATIHDTRNKVREHGGDDRIDAQLLAALQTQARAAVELAEGHLAKGQLRAAIAAVSATRGVPDIGADLEARAVAVHEAAAAVHDARARAAGDAHPLAARAHQAMAVISRGGQLADASALAAPYRESVEVATTGTCDPFAGPLRAALATPRGPRHADVAVAFTRCAADETVTPSTQEVAWDEEVFDHYDTKYEKKCYTVQKTISLGTGSCSVSGVGDRSYTQTCTPHTTTVPVQECTDVPFQVPVMRTEKRTATREVTTRRWTIAFAGTWTVRRGGEEWTGRFDEERTAVWVSAPAVGQVAARQEGGSTTFPQMFAVVSPARAIRPALARAFAPELEAAAAEARAAGAAGRVDAEEDAWMRVVLLGGDVATVAGFWERYGADAADPVAWFGPYAASIAVARDGLREVVAYELPEGGPADFSDREKTELRARVVPSLSAKFWMQFELAYVGLGAASAPGQPDLGGDVGGMFGMRAGGRVLTRKKKSPWGLQPVDEASAVIAAGTGGGAPERVVGASLTAHLEAAYAAGIGYRGFGGGGLMVGLRAATGLVYVKSGMPTYANLLPFARVEIARPKGAIAIEAMGFTLAGTEQWGVNVHLGHGSKDWFTPGRFVSLRIERSVHDLDLKAPSDDPYVDEMARAEGVSLTTVSVMYGIGSP